MQNQVTTLTSHLSGTTFIGSPPLNSDKRLIQHAVDGTATGAPHPHKLGRARIRYQRPNINRRTIPQKPGNNRFHINEPHVDPNARVSTLSLASARAPS